MSRRDIKNRIEAFNRYAERNGEPVMENGLYTHGSGYEWEDVFKKAFEMDENIGKIGFDCEASGFFCYAEDLTLLEELGRRFRALCMDTKSFESLVCSALQEATVRRAEAEELSGTIRGFLMECPGCEGCRCISLTGLPMRRLRCGKGAAIRRYRSP